MTTSEPMCSPSRSQSVQIISRSARRASSMRFRSTFLSFWRHVSTPTSLPREIEGGARQTKTQKCPSGPHSPSRQK
jgi:hypothetical protein